MSRIVIVVLIYHRHKPINRVKLHFMHNVFSEILTECGSETHYSLAKQKHRPVTSRQNN
jgi:hypothetical protein